MTDTTLNTSLDTVYLVDDSDQDVILEVVIGAAGQATATSIMLDCMTLYKNYSGTYSERPLGSNRSLHGKTLKIVAVVADGGLDANFTQMNLRLRGGLGQRQYSLIKRTNEEGDSSPYIALIEFFRA